jgi:hypothetical protein
MYTRKVNNIQTNTASVDHAVSPKLLDEHYSSFKHMHICMPKENKHTYRTTRTG